MPPPHSFIFSFPHLPDIPESLRKGWGGGGGPARFSRGEVQSGLTPGPNLPDLRHRLWIIDGGAVGGRMDGVAMADSSVMGSSMFPFRAASQTLDDSIQHPQTPAFLPLPILPICQSTLYFFPEPILYIQPCQYSVYLRRVANARMWTMGGTLDALLKRGGLI